MNTERITQDLIKFQTIEGNTEQFEKCLNYIEDCFSEDFRFERFEKDGEKALLISRGENPRILLHGHIDVVDAEKDQFEPELKDGRIYGRGAADMKSGLACLMKTLEETENKELALLLTSDEERGGFNGTGHVIEEKDLSPEIVISAEPDDSETFPSIVTKQKGVLQLRIKVEGKSAHASKPGKGENAAEKLIEKYREIEQLFSHEKEFSTTVNLGKLFSPGPVNKVPEEAEMELDIRFSQQYPKKKVLSDIRNIENINVKVLTEAPMMETSEESQPVKSLNKSAEEVSGRQIKFRKENFASDMRFFTEKGIPAVCFGPEGYNLHGENEFVEVESLETYCEILKNFLDREFS